MSEQDKASVKSHLEPRLDCFKISCVRPFAPCVYQENIICYHKSCHQFRVGVRIDHCDLS